MRIAMMFSVTIGSAPLSLLARREAAHEAQEPHSFLPSQRVPRRYCMDAAAMSLELHGCGIHAV